MHKFFKIIAVTIACILLAMALIPLLFKSEMKNAALEAVNNNIEAEISLGDFHISLFRHFPRLSIGFDELLVYGKNEFKADTVLAIDGFYGIISLKGLIQGKYSVYEIELIKPMLNLRMLENGKANWDILPENSSDNRHASPPENKEENNDESTLAFNINLQEFTIIDASVFYSDDQQGIEVSALGYYQDLRGDFSNDANILYALSNIESLSLAYNGIPMINKKGLMLEGNFEADLSDNQFGLKDTKFVIGDLLLDLQALIQMKGDSLNVDMDLRTKDNSFASLLSLVPEYYLQDFSDFDARGKMDMELKIKGLIDTDFLLLPFFELTMQINDGGLSYPGMPAEISDISFMLGLKNPGGGVDSIKAQIQGFKARILESKLAASFRLSHPLSDPDIFLDVIADLNLGDLKDAIPLENINVSGKMNADFSASFNESDLNAALYEDVMAEGSLGLNDVAISIYEKPDILIFNTLLSFSPEKLSLDSFNFQFGESDLFAKGSFSNYLSYITNDGILKGDFESSSQNIDVNEILSLTNIAFTDTINNQADANVETLTEDESPENLLPSNIDFSLQSAINKLKYGKTEMSNIKTRIELSNGNFIIQKLNAYALGGSAEINGSLSTGFSNETLLDMDIHFDTIDFTAACNSISLIENYAPILSQSYGKFSTDVKISTLLDSELLPVYNSLNAKGKLKTTKLTLKGSSLMDRLADNLKVSALKSQTLKDVNISYELIDGKLKVEPFDTRFGDLKANIGGYTSLDKSIDYIMKLQIPAKGMGESFGMMLNQLAYKAGKSEINLKSSDVVNVDVYIGGTLDKPTIKTGLKEAMTNQIEEIKKKAEAELKKKKEEAMQAARQEAEKYLAAARKRADDLMQEAESQSKKIINTAEVVASRIRNEAGKQANDLKKEATGKGMIAKIAAEKAAGKIVQEAENNARNIEEEARQKANGITDKARLQANKIIKDAENKLNDIKP